MSSLDADNLEAELTQDGRLVVEPQYLGYLRNNGYQIDELQQLHAVNSDGAERAHIVAKVKTYEYPRDDPRLDYAEHALSLWTCDCWSFRTDHSAAVHDDGVTPSETTTCKHIRRVSKAESAKADAAQETLL